MQKIEGEKMSAILLCLLHHAVPLLVDLAVKYGLPAASQWILKVWPKVPQAVIDGIMQAITAAVNALEGVHPASPEAKAIRTQAKVDCRSAISSACDTKGLD